MVRPIISVRNCSKAPATTKARTGGVSASCCSKCSAEVRAHAIARDTITRVGLSVTPFNPNQNESEIPSRVLAGRISWPRTIDDTTKAFIKKLLLPNPDKRLGAGKNGSREVKEQPVFASIRWDDVYARKLKAPIVPKLEHPGDTSCFDQYKEDWRSAPFASDKELDLFADF